MTSAATIVDPHAKAEHGLGNSYGGKIDAPDEIGLRITNCFGEANVLAPGPQAFIVDAPADTEVAAHWHPVNQWQLHVGTPGTWYRKKDVPAFMLHYADAYRTYGPFGSHGPGRLSFFVLRAIASAETGWMPDDREKMKAHGKRVHHLWMDERPSDGSSTQGFDALIPPDQDGLAAYRGFLDPGEVLAGPEFVAGAVGRYYCVIGGSLLRDQEAFPASTLMWQEPGQELPELRAADGGADVLIVQFPDEPVYQT